MTTLIPAPRRTSVALDGARLTFAGTLRSELIKLLTLRSTVWSYALVIAISVGLAALVAFALISTPGGAPGVEPPGAQPTQTVVLASLAGVNFGQLVAGVLGVLVISGEYTTGMVRSTFAAVPKRIPALAAKGIVLFVATFVVGLIASVASYLLASLVLGQEDISAPMAEPAVFWPLLGASFYLAVVSVFALGVGALVRSSAGGIAGVLGILLILPIVLQLVPAEWARDVVPYLFSTAGAGIYTSTTLGPDGDAFGVWINLLITALWVGVSMGTAAVLMRRRDA